MKKLNLTTISVLIISFFAYFTANSQENILPETGKVGIGTLNPSAKLDVNGKVHIDSMLLVKDSILIQKNARIQKNLKVEGDTKFEQDAEVQKELTVNGNTILKGDLMVDQSVFLNTLQQVNGLANSKIVVYDAIEKKLNGLDPAFFVDEVYKIPCLIQDGDVLNPTWNNGTNKIFSECPHVNVGIATTVPRVSLDVLGTTYSQKLFLGNLTPTNSNVLFHAKANLNQNQDRDLFILENNSRKIFQINNNGLVQAREIKVNLQNWPDYVFEKEYKLMPLQDVEKFILENKHLPNVPNTKTIESEGMNLGEMNKILMEKIEELTLHLIEQEKKMIDFESELNKIKQINKK
jgi:hypothetical protein